MVALNSLLQLLAISVPFGDKASTLPDVPGIRVGEVGRYMDGVAHAVSITFHSRAMNKLRESVPGRNCSTFVRDNVPRDVTRTADRSCEHDGTCKTCTASANTSG